MKEREVILLVGIPGSGKSTYAATVYPYHIAISQDEFGGSRKKFLDRYNAILQLGDSIVIDRCNVTKEQRQTLINIAKAHKVTVFKCVVLDTDKKTCYNRIKNRKGHQTITENTSPEKIQSIIDSFEKTFETPTKGEGFETITVISSTSIADKPNSISND